MCDTAKNKARKRQRFYEQTVNAGRMMIQAAEWRAKREDAFRRIQETAPLSPEWVFALEDYHDALVRESGKVKQYMELLPAEVILSAERPEGNG